MSEVTNEVENQEEIDTEVDETGAQGEDTTVSKKEFDRRVDSLTAKIKSFDEENADLKAKLAAFEKEKTEKSYSKMTAEQRKEADLAKQIKDFEKQKAEFTRKQLTLDISTDLQEKGLPKSFAKVLALSGDSEEIIAIVDEAVKEQQEILKANLKQQLSGKTTTRNSNNTGVTKEQFNKMTLAERTELYSSNKELYQKLTK